MFGGIIAINVGAAAAAAAAAAAVGIFLETVVGPFGWEGAGGIEGRKVEIVETCW